PRAPSCCRPTRAWRRPRWRRSTRCAAAPARPPRARPPHWPPSRAPSRARPARGRRWARARSTRATRPTTPRRGPPRRASTSSPAASSTSPTTRRSTDDGRSWTDVKLPTSSCAGHTFDDRNCFLANIVTDVVVQAGSNTSTKGAQPGAVLAAVGWRAGRRANIKGKPESPHNGIYTSPTGAPGSFRFVDPTASNFTNGDPTAPGRIALGIANGPTQNHNIVYALVQDANSFNGEIGQDVLDEAPTGVF